MRTLLSPLRRFVKYALLTLDFPLLIYVRVLALFTQKNRRTLEKRRYNALEKWTEGLENMQTQILGRLAAPGDRNFAEFS